MHSNKLNTDLLISAYLQGFFPMAQSEEEIVWYNPDPRAIIPLNAYKPSKSLRNILNRTHLYQVKIDTNFRAVMEHCAKPRSTDDGIWINSKMITEYTKLNELGLAHSVEVYYDGILTGGLYGVHLGAAFFGESMFHLQANASKIAFHYLVSILNTNEFVLLDTQFINDNVKRLGAIETPKQNYLGLLKNALDKKAHFRL